MIKISIAIYGSHDSSICLSPANGVYRIYEFERLLGERYVAINKLPPDDFKKTITRLKSIIEKEYGEIIGGSCFFAQLDYDLHLTVLKEVFGFIHFEEISHHSAHAAGALYQSPYEEAIIISSDSGGHEMQDGVQTFCVFHGDKKRPMNHVLKKIGQLPLDVCGAYTLLAVPVSEIKKEDVYSKYLSYAGKIMGLAAYGNIRQDWTKAISDFYYGPIDLDYMAKLGEKINLDLSGINKISGQDSFDLAATSQAVFENITFHAIKPFIEKYKLPVILTGGGGLNVLFNQHLKNSIDYPVFIPCNPNDCGLSFGMLMLREPANSTVDVSLSGFGILDIDKLPEYCNQYNAIKVNYKQLAHLLSSGRIIGVVRGNSEAGPRALGNRSILCYPGYKGMKDKLNSKIKFREWFRPFAPVIQQQEWEDYFEEEVHSPWMTFAPAFLEDVQDHFPSVVHRDGTGRVQTVTKESNPFLYDLLNELGNVEIAKILLNTSFNIKGKPILTTIEEALYVLENTELDYVLIEDYLFSKNKEYEC